MLNRDVLNLLTKLTWKRVQNAVALVSSYYLSKCLKRPIQWGKPISISIEPTTSCNLRCPECPSGLRQFTRPTGMLNMDLFQQLIQQTHQHLLYLNLYFQGEPYLNKNFLQFVRLAKQKKIYTSTSTNAHYLTDEMAQQTVLSGLDRLIISIDGTTQDIYSAYRIGGQLNKVIEGTQRVVYWKKQLKSKTPYLIFQFLVVKPNQHQIQEAAKLAKQIGVDTIKFKTAQIYDYKNGNELIPTIDKYSRYRKNKKGQYELKNKLLNQCWRMWHSCVVTWDGRVVPCCFDKDAKHQLGDIQKKSLKEIWYSQKYFNFRASILKGRANIDICKNCTEGTKIWG